jgi:hypothetical protein
MVFMKQNKRATASKSHKTKPDMEGQGFFGSPSSKNQLLHPVSPYDELPIIQDLFERLTPRRIRPPPSPHMKTTKPQRQDDSQARSTSKVNGRHEHHSFAPQQREQSNQTMKERVGGCQQRDQPYHMSSARGQREAEEVVYNGAHDVPSVIEFPSIPTLSEDSEVTLDSIWKDEEESEHRRLTPHPSFEELKMPSFDLHHLYHASVQAEQEMWPSDEDSAPRVSREKSHYQFWSHGSIHVWNLEGEDENNELKPKPKQKEKAQISRVEV